MSRLRLPSASTRFELLRNVGNLFIVAPENVRSLVDESNLRTLPEAELVALVKQRANYKSEREKLARGFNLSAA